MNRGVQATTTEPSRDPTSTGAFASLVSEALLSRAASLARRGEYAAAESLLGQLPGSGNENPRVLDLLARIQAQQGCFSEAEALWRRALEVEAGNGSYRAGLERIEKMRSRSPWAIFLLPVGAAFIAILTVILVGFLVRNQIVQLRESVLREVAGADSVIVGMARERQAKDAAEAEEKVASGTGVPSTQRIEIQLDGATVRTERRDLVVSFDEGLFSSGANLKEDAQSLLSELGTQLQPHRSDISIRVVGHTDDIQVPNGSAYADNARLGLARAVAVADYLSRDAGLPVDQFLLRSAGESEPPYPNDTWANRLRNRTVVLEIVPANDRQGGAP
jgi:flagellar motor protein MotB